jgi:hypothetical protein
VRMVLVSEVEADRRAAVAQRLQGMSVFPIALGLLSVFVTMAGFFAFRHHLPHMSVALPLKALAAAMAIGTSLVTYVVMVKLWWRWAIQQGVDLHQLEELVEEGWVICRPNTLLGRLQRRWLMVLPPGYPDEPAHHTINRHRAGAP